MDQPFVVNLADAPARTYRRLATIIEFEPAGAPWPDTGVNVQIKQPGEPNCRYRSEPVQEDFLLLHGECGAIVNGAERPLRQWDFLHCPGGTEHVFVGGGDRPCAVLAIRSRRKRGAHYPVNKVAAKYDASVTNPTDGPTRPTPTGGRSRAARYRARGRSTDRRLADTSDFFVNELAPRSRLALLRLSTSVAPAHRTCSCCALRISRCAVRTRFARIAGRLLHRRGRASARENLGAEQALVEVDQTIEIVGHQCDVVPAEIRGPRVSCG